MSNKNVFYCYSSLTSFMYFVSKIPNGNLHVYQETIHLPPEVDAEKLRSTLMSISFVCCRFETCAQGKS